MAGPLPEQDNLPKIQKIDDYARRRPKSQRDIILR